MVILKRIFSDNDLFNEVRFKKGINIIQGKYSTNRELNGIGKSTLVRLIDFALLSDSGAKKYFDPKKYEFLKESSVILEFETNNQQIYFAKRNFEDPQVPRFGPELSNLTPYKDDQLKLRFGNLFFGQNDYNGIYKDSWFRTLIKFFIKDDINNFERKNPLKFYNNMANDFESYIYNLFLLNLPNEPVNNYKESRTKEKELRKSYNNEKIRIESDSGKKLEEINSEIAILSNKIKLIESTLEKFDFNSTYLEFEKELVSLTNEISKNLKSLSHLRRNLDEYEKTHILDDIDIDLEKIERIYSGTKEIFGELVKKNVDDVLKFRKKIAENRARFLSNKEEEIRNEINNIDKRISDLENRRSILYRLLDEKDALDSIKNNYKLLIEEKSKIERLNQSIARINKFNEEINENNTTVSNSISEISKTINEMKNQINLITSLFMDFIRNSIHTESIHDAVFDITTQPYRNSPLKITIDVPKSEALGKSRYKILAYDLTLFMHNVNIQRNFPRFLIHDGIFWGIDIKTIIKTLNYVNSSYLKNPRFQYIITGNQKEFFIDDETKKIIGDYSFDLNDCTIATYTDDPKDMIFKKEY